jgi:hypothetical protein
MQQQVMMDALGSLGTDPKALPGVLNVFGDLIKNKVSIHNKTVQEAENAGVRFPYDPRVKLDTPKAAQTGGVKFLGFE